MVYRCNNRNLDEGGSAVVGSSAIIITLLLTVVSAAASPASESVLVVELAVAVLEAVEHRQSASVLDTSQGRVREKKRMQHTCHAIIVVAFPWEQPLILLYYFITMLRCCQHCWCVLSLSLLFCFPSEKLQHSNDSFNINHPKITPGSTRNPWETN